MCAQLLNLLLEHALEPEVVLLAAPALASVLGAAQDITLAALDAADGVAVLGSVVAAQAQASVPMPAKVCSLSYAAVSFWALAEITHARPRTSSWQPWTLQTAWLCWARSWLLRPRRPYPCPPSFRDFRRYFKSFMGGPGHYPGPGRCRRSCCAGSVVARQAQTFAPVLAKRLLCMLALPTPTQHCAVICQREQAGITADFLRSLALLC